VRCLVHSQTRSLSWHFSPNRPSVMAPKAADDGLISSISDPDAFPFSRPHIFSKILFLPKLSLAGGNHFFRESLSFILFELTRGRSVFLFPPTSERDTGTVCSQFFCPAPRDFDPSRVGRPPPPGTNSSLSLAKGQTTHFSFVTPCEIPSGLIPFLLLFFWN